MIEQSCFQNFVRKGVVRAGEAHRVGGHQGQFHALADRDQAAIHQLLRGIAVEGELEVQPVRLELHKPAYQAICLDGLGRIARMLDRRGQDAPATWHAGERDHSFAVGLKIPPVDTGTSPIGACQEPAVRQADYYVESVKAS